MVSTLYFELEIKNLLMITQFQYLLYLCVFAICCQCTSSSKDQKTSNNDTLAQQQSESQKNNATDNSSNQSPEQRIKNIIEAYFSLYAQGDWDKLASYYAPQITQFISIKNAQPAQVTASAKSFFKDKANIKYTPDLRTCKITPSQNGWNASLELDMQWNRQQTRVLLELAFLQKGCKIVLYKEGKVISHQRAKAMNQDLFKLFKNIPDRLLLPGMDLVYPIDTSNREVIKLGFAAVPQVWQVVGRLLDWQDRTILVLVHSGGTSHFTKDRQSRQFNSYTNVYFFEKADGEWSTPNFLSEETIREIGGFFAQKQVEPQDFLEPEVTFQGNDITIEQGKDKAITLKWNAGTYYIASKYIGN